MKNKRILIVTQYIYPENFKSNDIAFELAKRGYHVEVLTGIPNYPSGKYFKGYGLLNKRYEKYGDVKFYRCFQTPRGRNATGLGLSLNYISFVCSSILWVFFYFMWKKRYMAIITHEPSPITQLIPAIILGKFRKIPVYSWIMDIWPDAIKTNVSDNLYLKLYPILNGITEWTYRNSDKILITSKGFKDLICRYHNYSDKIIYFPNWSLDMSTEDIKLECPILPDGFKIMLAGNIGESQDLEAIGKCMILLKKYSNVKWIFIGDGSKKKWLESFVKENCLTETSVILGSYPISYMPNFYKMADAMLVTLKSGYFDLEMTVPARLQSYMSAGKPILAMIGKGAADLIRDSNCGYAVPSSNYEALADIIINKILPNREAFINKGKNGRLCYEKEFSLDVCIDHLENILQQKKQ